MSTSRHVAPYIDDLDLASLGGALWRAKWWIIGLALGAGSVTTIGLSMMRPLYKSEARILIQNEESAFTPPTLRASLNAAKSASAGLSGAEVKLWAMQREAKAKRELLESYLAGYRDAWARHDMGAVPAHVTIVSRAHASVLPFFTNRGPLSLLVVTAIALLAIKSDLAKTIMTSVPEPRYAGDQYILEEPDTYAPEYIADAEMTTMRRAERAPPRVRPEEYAVRPAEMKVIAAERTTKQKKSRVAPVDTRKNRTSTEQQVLATTPDTREPKPDPGHSHGTI